MNSLEPTTPSRRGGVIPEAHKLATFSEWTQIREGVRKRPQHQCKVCSIRKTKVGERSGTRFFCEACSDDNKPVYLCDRVRPRHYPNNNMTYHQIWYLKWKNGEERPRSRVGRDIQMCGLEEKRRYGNAENYNAAENEMDAQAAERAKGNEGAG